MPQAGHRREKSEGKRGERSKKKQVQERRENGGNRGREVEEGEGEAKVQRGKKEGKCMHQDKDEPKQNVQWATTSSTTSSIQRAPLPS